MFIEDFLSLPIDLVITSRGEEVETVRTDRFHKDVAATGKDYYAVVGVLANMMKEVNELFVGVPVEHSTPPLVEHFEHPGLGANQACIGKSVAVYIKARSRSFLCWWSKFRFVGSRGSRSCYACWKKLHRLPVQAVRI